MFYVIAVETVDGMGREKYIVEASTMDAATKIFNPLVNNRPMLSIVPLHDAINYGTDNPVLYIG